jgi:hypothetical protein
MAFFSFLVGSRRHLLKHKLSTEYGGPIDDEIGYLLRYDSCATLLRMTGQHLF